MLIRSLARSLTHREKKREKTSAAISVASSKNSVKTQEAVGRETCLKYPELKVLKRRLKHRFIQQKPKTRGEF